MAKIAILLKRRILDERRSKWAGYSSEKEIENAAIFAKHAKSGALARLADE